jgi:hypothetical protein
MTDGAAVPEPVLTTARAVYDAAIHHDFGALRQLLHDLPAAVARPVVDQHDLEVVARRARGDRAQALMQGGEAGFLIEARNDDRERGHFGIR